MRATRRLALWQNDLDNGVCAVPEEAVEELSGRAAVPLVLEHRERGVTATTRTFATTPVQDVEWQLAGVEWPGDVRPGTLIAVTWQASRGEVVARTIPLDEPVRVDGVDYFHEYDARVVTREFPASPSNRGKVLLAVCRKGRVFDDGSAVLPESALPAQAGLGRGQKGQFLLKHAVDQLIREGYLTRVDGSVDGLGYPSYPAVDGQKAADLLFYAPLVDEYLDGEGGDRADHWVNGFVRRLPAGAHPSEKQVQLHERAVEDEQVESVPLAPGHTFVRKHHRG